MKKVGGTPGSFHPVERLTVQEVLSSKGFEDMTEQQAEAYIDDLEALCRIIVHVELNKGGDYGYSQAA